MEAFIKTNSIDIISLSETFLESTIPHNDERIYIRKYSMIRTDHTNNTKRGSVCIYFKKSLPLTRKIVICKLNECIVAEITVNNERCFLTTDQQVNDPYRSTSQNQEHFESFFENLVDVLSDINN